MTKDSQDVVFITGASSGIGYAAALKFAEAGYAVAGSARSATRLEPLVQAIQAVRGTFLPLTADVTDPQQMAAAVDAIRSAYGRLDVLVANAGVGHRGSMIDSEWDGMETMLRTNIDGVLHTIRAGVPLMQSSGGGHVLIVSSAAYNLVAPYAAIYAASKAFVSSLAHSLRLELEADQIDVTDMLVGRVDTAFNNNRLGKSGRGGSFPPSMPVEKVAEEIVKAVGSKRKSIALRWVDRLLLLGNRFIPDIIGRRALKQYQ